MKHTKITPQIAALYLGQKFEIVKNPTHWDDEDRHSIGRVVGPQTILFLRSYLDLEICLHLRSLDSITEEEAIHVHDDVMGFPYSGILPCIEWICLGFPGNSSFYQDARGYPTVWLYLLSKGFDLFNLIQSGLAKEIK